MAEHIQKKARYEKLQDREMPSPQPDIAADEPVSSEVAVQPLYDRSQEEDENTRMTTTSINQMLLSREICCGTAKIPKFPNIFRDYFLELYDSPLSQSYVDFVIAGDIIVLNCNLMFILPYSRDGGGFSPLTDKDGKNIEITKRNDCVFYNNHNNSLIIVEVDEKSECTSILSLKIESIKAGLTKEQINICPQDNNTIGGWSIDIPNCRGMLYNKKERLFKVFELKEYTTLFTIPEEGDDSFCSYLRFGSPGNMELIVKMFNKISARREEILLTIYSKVTGQLRKRISIPVYPNHGIKHVQLYGTDRILVQQSELGMQIFDISAQISKIIKTSDFQVLGCPEYLYKRNLLIAHTEMRGTRGINVFNLQGETVLTFQDHRLCESNLLIGSHITTEEDIVLSVCSDKKNMQDATEPGLFTINISSILTGKCIGKITTATPNCSKLRKLALRSLLPISFAYNETTHEIFTSSRNGDIYIWSNQLDSDINKSIYDRNSSTDEEDDGTDESTDEEDIADDDHGTNEEDSTYGEDNHDDNSVVARV